MKWKKIIAGVMAIVFFLNLIHINVNAKVKTEDAVSGENTISSKEEATETNSTKEVANKIAEVSVEGMSTIVNLISTRFGSLLSLIGTGIKYMATGFCLAVGALIAVEGPEYVPHMIHKMKHKLHSKPKHKSARTHKERH